MGKRGASARLGRQWQQTTYLALLALAVAMLTLAGCARDAATQPPASVTPLAQAAAATTVEATPMARPTLAATEAATPAETAAPPAEPVIAPTQSPSPVPTLAPGARISIPRLGVDAPLVETTWHIEVIDGQEVAVWDTPEAAAGHHLGSALPGQTGNCVISAHSRATASETGVFFGLWDLAVGDAIVVQDEAGNQFAYEVVETTTLPELGEDLAQRKANALQAMAPTADQRLTLITCWPDWAYTHRLVVVAEPAPVSDAS